MIKALNRVYCLIVLLTGVAMPLAHADDVHGPKPLQADTPSVGRAGTAASKKGELPQDYVDMQKHTEDEFNAWLKDDSAIRNACEYPTSPTMRFECEKKKQASEARLDIVHAHKGVMLRKIENWRRQQVGMPTVEAEEAADARASGVSTPGAGGVPARPASPPPTPILLPQDDKSLPPGTF